ncbi:MAG: 50S ribosomal protein L18 [Zetaproteobacteria bacterium]|nr:MAG: 50S ribosomal protein L18 [Zetaproteobacteria bacterium]
MSRKRYERNAAVRRARRVRARVKASGRLRLSVFRSARHIYAQIIDDARGVTLVSASSLDEEVAYGGNCEGARRVGELLARRATALDLGPVSFDRGPYPYHGRVKALAEGARSGGLDF